MCSTPDVKIKAPPPVQAPTEQDPAVTSAMDEERRRRRAAASGRQSTIATGGQGVTAPANVGFKTLLGG